jgi:DNA-binding NtrC family response regulator
MMQPPVADNSRPIGSQEPAPRPLSQISSYILIVDDDPGVRNLMTRCLQNWGYAAKHAGSAAQALETMRSEPASLVLCDVKMPGEDGLWLAERLHAHWPLVPIIMVTALDDPETIRQSKRVGAADFIKKPITPDLLLQALRRTMSIPLEAVPSADEPPSFLGQETSSTKSEAEYRLEYVVKCPSCGDKIETLKAVRLIRTQVNFTSTLPRRGRVLACPQCLAIIPAELSNF